VSIAVPLDELAATVAGYPWCYLVTSGEERPHVLAVMVAIDDGVLRCRTGNSSRRNVARSPQVVLAFPAMDPGSMSLIVDGSAIADDDGVAVTPTGAVLHRAAV
jgi:hypothetical protein